VLLGFFAGSVATSSGALKLKLDEIPVADVATLCLSIAALVWVPLVVSRFERRGAFDRKAVADHLAPARDKLLAIEELLATANDPSAARDNFIGNLRSMRTNIDHARRIAELWKWNAHLMATFEDAEMQARRLNRIATGDKPSARLGEAQEAARSLHETLLALLRASA
jgi:hypothetical protein